MSIVPGRDVQAVPEEWVDAVNTAINDANHEDLCACDGWPDACRSYKPGLWDLGEASLHIAISVLEPLIRARIAAEDAPRVDRVAQVLECIQAESGQWTGLRAARALAARFGWWQVTPERAVQLMRKLVERGQLVVANPPRGATFVLPFGPGGEVEYEWSTNVGGHTDPGQLLVASERMARSRREEWPVTHPKLLRREVKRGPWVEVDPAEGET